MPTRFRDIPNVTWDNSTTANTTRPTANMQGLEASTGPFPEQDMLRNLQQMEELADILEREYRPCPCNCSQNTQISRSVDIQDLGLIDLSGTDQHLKELHSVSILIEP